MTDDNSYLGARGGNGTGGGIVSTLQDEWMTNSQEHLENGQNKLEEEAVESHDESMEKLWKNSEGVTIQALGKKSLKKWGREGEDFYETL